MLQPALAYSAGFMDADGSFLVLKQRQKSGNHVYSPRLHAANTKKPPLLLLQQLFGGYIVEGKPVQDNHRPVYRWSVSAAQARRAVQALLPYLIIKQEQATLLAEWPASKHGVPCSSEMRQRQLEIRRAVQALNRRGR